MGRENLQLLLGLVRRDPGLTHELVEGEPDADREPVADLRAHRLADLQQYLTAVAHRAAVAVGPVVVGEGSGTGPADSCARHCSSTPVAARDLDVERRLPELPDHVVDVLLLHHQRDFVVHDRGQLGDTPERVPLVHDHRALVVDAAAEELNELSRAVLVHRVGELGVLGDGTFFPQAGAAFDERALADPVDRPAAR